MITYLEKLNDLLNVPQSNDNELDYFKSTTKDRFNIILKALNSMPQLTGTGNSNNWELMYSIGDEYLHTIIQKIKAPVLLDEHYNIIQHPDYLTDRSCDVSIEQQIYMWDYNLEKKVFLIHYKYNCEYHENRYYIINILTPEDFIKIMDEIKPLFIVSNKDDIISKMNNIL